MVHWSPVRLVSKKFFLRVWPSVALTAAIVDHHAVAADLIGVNHVTAALPEEMMIFNYLYWLSKECSCRSDDTSSTHTPAALSLLTQSASWSVRHLQDWREGNRDRFKFTIHTQSRCVCVCFCLTSAVVHVSVTRPLQHHLTSIFLLQLDTIRTHLWTQEFIGFWMLNMFIWLEWSRWTDCGHSRIQNINDRCPNERNGHVNSFVKLIKFKY